MTSTDLYSPRPSGAATRTTTTMSFGNHRALDVPASALGAGVSTEPRAFRRPGADAPAARHDEVPTIGALLMRPVLRVFGTAARARIGLGVIAVLALGYILF